MMTERNSFYVYFFYDSDDNLLYVGKTTCMRLRMKQHFSKSCMKEELWKNLVDKDKITIYRCNNSTDMSLYEIFFINKYKPLYNKDFVFNSKPTFELPELIPIKPMESTKILMRLFNEEMNDYVKKSFIGRLSEPVDEDFCCYNKTNNRLEVCF